MELVKIEGTSPVDLIEEYSSLIWTNRFFEAGDFQLKTPKIEETINLIPPGTILGLLDDPSQSAMVVEEHVISVDEYGRPELTVTGRGAQVIHEGRPAIKFIDEPLEDHEYVFENISPSKLIHYIISDSYVPVSSKVDQEELAIWNRRTMFSLPANDPKIVQNYQVPRQDVYSTVLDIARTYGLGVDMTWRYTKEYKEKYPLYSLWNYIHYGKDLRNPNVPMFSGKKGDFLSEDYRFSHKNYFNSVFVYTKNTANSIWLEGFDKNTRRIKTIDATDIVPPKDYILNKKKIEYENSVGKERARQELYRYSRRKFLSVEVSPAANAKYGEDYRLGDIITVEGTYSGIVDMRVEEYVRSEDEQGERAFPGFAEYVLPNMEGMN